GVAGIYAFAEMVHGLMLPARKRCRRALLIPFGSAVLSLGILLPSAAWRIHLDTDLAGFGRTVIPAEPEQYARVAELFLRAATDPSDRAFQAVFLCTALSVSAIIYGRIRLGKWWRLTWILPAVILVTAGYYAGMLYMYLY